VRIFTNLSVDGLTVADFPVNDGEQQQENPMCKLSEQVPGAPEVTDEMLAAGICALPAIDLMEIGSWTEEKLVREVYLAMDAVRRARP
jgi:hypothetical protein